MKRKLLSIILSLCVAVSALMITVNADYKAPEEVSQSLSSVARKWAKYFYYYEVQFELDKAVQYCYIPDIEQTYQAENLSDAIVYSDIYFVPAREKDSNEFLGYVSFEKKENGFFERYTEYQYPFLDFVYENFDKIYNTVNAENSKVLFCDNKVMLNSSMVFVSDTDEYTYFSLSEFYINKNADYNDLLSSGNDILAQTQSHDKSTNDIYRIWRPLECDMFDLMPVFIAAYDKANNEYIYEEYLTQDEETIMIPDNVIPSDNTEDDVSNEDTDSDDFIDDTDIMPVGNDSTAIPETSNSFDNLLNVGTLAGVIVLTARKRK